MSATDRTTGIDLFCEFFEVLVHNILYARRVYPETVFERKRKYGIIVYKSLHPDINLYISEVVKSIQFHLRRNQLQHIYLCLLSSGRVIEKFNFDILKLTNKLDSDPFLVQFEESLRDFCLKLSASVNYTSPLPDDTSFNIQLDVTEYSSLEYNQNPNFENFPWICINEKENRVASAEIIPVATAETDLFQLQIYIEKTGLALF